MPQIERSTPEVLQSIQEKAVRVRNAAALLTQRIEQFEAYLSTLNGRVEAYAYGTHPDASQENPVSLGLGLERNGKEWQITCTTLHCSQDPDESAWTPLKDASLKIKVAGVRMFPDLLQAIEKSQDYMVENINKAVTEFDAFAATLQQVNPIPSLHELNKIHSKTNDSGGTKERALPPLAPLGKSSNLPPLGKQPIMPPLAPPSVTQRFSESVPPLAPRKGASK